MTEHDAGVVVVGAGLGAVRLAGNLRNGGYTGPITLVGAEPYAPYDRPPLSKSVLLGKDDRVELKPAEYYHESEITLRLGTRVESVDPETRTIAIRSVNDAASDGSGGIDNLSCDTLSCDTLSYDTLVLATGLVPRTIPGSEGLAGVHVLRTFDDAVGVREEIDAARTAVVIGAGFIGCEVAASLAERGLNVTLIEPAPTPLAAALGTTVGELITRMHTERGVDVRVGVGVDELVGDTSVRAVRCSDGTEIPADIVVVGIGSIPVTDYLEGSSITLADRADGGGVACDGVGRTSAPAVFALGDVANWHDEKGAPRRVEHWNHTVDQAVVVARQILSECAAEVAEQAAAEPIPYFWSDQFGLKLQVLGSPRADHDLHLVSDDGTKFLGYYSCDGILTAVVGMGKAGAVMKTRPKLQTPTPVSELL